MAVKIGDLFHDGHNYYQAVAVTAKTVTVRQIKSKCVRHGDTRTAFDYDLVMKPLRNEFTDCVFFSDKQNKHGRRCKKQPMTNDPDGPVQILLSNAYGPYASAYQLTDDEVTVEVNWG